MVREYLERMALYAQGAAEVVSNYITSSLFHEPSVVGMGGRVYDSSVLEDTSQDSNPWDRLVVSMAKHNKPGRRKSGSGKVKVTIDRNGKKHYKKTRNGSR